MKEKQDLEHVDGLDTEDLELVDLDLEDLDQLPDEPVQQPEENLEHQEEDGKAEKDEPPKKRRKRKGFYKEYAVIGVLALALLAVVIFAGSRFFGKKGDPALNAKGKTVEETVSKEQEKAAKEEEEKKAVVDSYKNLGIVEVTGYLNVRETASPDADVIGKLQDGGACEILDDSTEEWYHISSGGIEGYISAEYVLTGEKAREKAMEEAALRATITADSLNIRKEPGTSAEVVGQALKGERYLL